MSEKFQRDLIAWKKTRPEYRALCDAIKDSHGTKADAAILALADDAGCGVNEVSELRSLCVRASAQNTRERAAKYKEVTKKLDAIGAEIAEVEKTLGTAKTLPAQSEAESRLYELCEAQQQLRLEYADAQVAATCVNAAEKAGVI